MQRGGSRFCATAGRPVDTRSRGSATLPLAIGLMFFAQVSLAADTPDRKAILSSFELHPDFQIELVASEPQVFSPVDVEFDERGRPFVMEMLGYPFPNDPGRIVVLDDKDGDGVYETRKVFAEGFAMANSLLPYNGGLLVISPPDILFLKDTNGDDVADVREVVLTGLAVGNPEDSVNGLSYGLDNWIYATNGGNSGILQWPDGGESLPLRADDFRFDPRHKRFERTGRAAQGFEMTFDPWGRSFSTNHTGPLYHRVFPGSYLEGLPQPRGGTLKALPDDIENGLVRIYPIGEQVTRVNHPEQSGYFSGACSPRFYGGGAFGPGFDTSIFVCDVVLNLIHRRILEPAGASFVARRDDRTKAEFLASTDRAFRPVNLSIAPDGSLWVVDMHRVIIEHPEWIPDEIEKTLDLNAGKNHGRLFRITPKSGLPRVRPNFRPEKIEDVVAALEQPNQWWRNTAQRLLVEWNDGKSVALLEKLARESSVPVARAHALWTLENLGELDDETVRKALYNPIAEVREQALRLSEQRLNRSPDLLNAASQCDRDPAPRVRMWSALVLSRIAPPPLGSDPGKDLASRALYSMIPLFSPDQFSRLALLPGLLRTPYPSLSLALYRGNGHEPRDTGWPEMIGLLAEGAAPRLSANETIGLLHTAAQRATETPENVRALIAGLATGLESHQSARGGSSDQKAVADALAPLLSADSLPLLRESWRLARALHLDRVPGQEEALQRADAAVRDATLPPDTRFQNLRIVEFAPFPARAELLYALLDTREPRELQREAIQQLQREGTNEVAGRLIAMWRLLGPETRPIAGDTLLYKRGNHPLLLSALEDSTISLGEMNFHLERRRALLHSGDPEVVRRAEALFSDAGVVTRKDAIEKMKPALDLTGSPAKGKEVFTTLCIRCHTKGTAGGDIGPNLTEIYRKSRETLLHDILDPNAAAEVKYIAYTIERMNGEIVSGLIAEETDATVTIRDANGVRTMVPRGDINEMLSGGLSLMPEELETGLDPQALADLLAYLQERE